jgi:hypothetical protein
MNEYDDCVLWTGSRLPQGYGQKTINGTTYLVHRLAWAEEHGPIPDGLWVLHHCDNPPCYNVDHLFLGDNAANMRDMASKGRNWQQKKTTCPVGHPLAEPNLVRRVLLGRGHRVCRTCERDSAKRSRLARIARGLPADDPRHGTLNGYGNWGCRCEPCRAAQAERDRRRQGRAPRKALTG